MALPKQSTLIAARNERIAQEKAAADPRRIELARLQKERDEIRNKYDTLFRETGNKTYSERSDNARRKYNEKIRTVERALRKDISISEQQRSERSKNARQKRQYAVNNQERVLTDKFGKEVVAAMSPEAKATAYEQATNKNFISTPNTARQKDVYNVRQEANARAQKSIAASGARTAGEYFATYQPSAGVASVANSQSTSLRSPATPRARLSPTTTLLSEPNTSTESGAVFTPPPAPNTSTAQGAVYSSPRSSPQQVGFFQASKERLPSAVKVAGSQIYKGNLFTDGLSSDSKNPAEQGLYRVGQGLNIIPAGGALKVVQLGGKAYTTYKAGKTYQQMSRAGKVGSNIGFFAASQTAVIASGTQVAKFYETQQLKTNLQGYDITPQEFRGVVSSAVADSKKEGFFNSFKYGVSTRFGDDPAAYEASLNKQLSARGFSDAEIKNLKNVADTTRGTREVVEAGTLVASAGVTELFGRGGFSAVNSYANKVFTAKVLRESTLKLGGTFTKTPLAYTPFKPSLSSAQSLGITMTTKGSVLAIGGAGEASAQEFLTQNVRQEGRDYKQIFKQAYLGSTVAPALGVPIARSFEVGALGKGKGINVFANTVDVFEYAGDKTADAVTKLGKLSYDVPTITVGGSAKTPTYSYGSTNVQAEVQNNYFTTTNKGQDTFTTRTNNKFTIGTKQPKPEAPKPVSPRTVTPSFNFAAETTQNIPSLSKEPIPNTVPVPAPVPIPSGSRNTVPTPIPNTVPVPVPAPVPVPVPVPVPTTAPVPTPIPIPVTTSTPESGFFAVGGGLGAGSGYGKGLKKKLKYTPSAFSIITGYKGSRPSKGAVKTGFSIRPISSPPKKKSKKKKNDDELLSLLGNNGRKRKYKRFTSF